MCEEPMLIKLELGRKLPRKVLCMRKSALGVELMTLSTIIASLKLKSCIKNKQKIENAKDLITV